MADKARLNSAPRPDPDPSTNPDFGSKAAPREEEIEPEDRPFADGDDAVVSKYRRLVLLEAVARVGERQKDVVELSALIDEI